MEPASHGRYRASGFRVSQRDDGPAGDSQRMPCARESLQTLGLVAAGYGRNQTTWPSAVITILPGMPIWSALTNPPPSPSRGFT